MVRRLYRCIGVFINAVCVCICSNVVCGGWRGAHVTGAYGEMVASMQVINEAPLRRSHRFLVAAATRCMLMPPAVGRPPGACCWAWWARRPAGGGRCRPPSSNVPSFRWFLHPLVAATVPPRLSSCISACCPPPSPLRGQSQGPPAVAGYELRVTVPAAPPATRASRADDHGYSVRVGLQQITP